jgi:hypothetical protein
MDAGASAQGNYGLGFVLSAARVQDRAGKE